MLEEVFVPFEHPRHPPVATHVRSTLIVSSIQALRAHGHYEAYMAQLGPRAMEMTSLIAGLWIPIELGMEHYRAADRLGLPSPAIDALGANVSERISKTVWSFVLRVSRESGATPWTALARAHNLREHTWKGSDVAVMKLGPKEARFDWVGLPYSAVPYYVTAFGGFLRGIMELFSTKAYTKAIPSRCTATSTSHRISWV